MNNPKIFLDPTSQVVTVEDKSPTISVQWDNAVQKAVIETKVGPTVASRAYGILHTAMFDAWAAYDLGAVSTQLGDDLQRPDAESTVANKTEAMSFAAYRVLSELFPTETDAFDQLMSELNFDPENTTTDTSTAAGIGNVSAETLMEFRREDGSNQLNGYTDTTDYQPVNADHNNISDISRWTSESVPIESDGSQQTFLTPQWSVTQPFALDSTSELRPVAPEPFLLVEGASVDLDRKEITLADGSIVAISTDIVGNEGDENAIINKAFIDQTERVIQASADLTDKQKLIAEFWEDGGGTSFPPGTWMTFGQFVSARENNTLDEDALLFFSLANAVFDAGIATWEAKVHYDYARPVRTVRELGKLGLLNNATVGRDEITGEEGFVIEAWAGIGEGTKTILAENFTTYQTPGSDPSPPFSEYTSGHSSFSAAGAEILQRFTGSDAFDGSINFQPGESRFENLITPVVATELAWETFSDAADEAGLSRIFGGIHFDDGDINGRSLGRQVGGKVWEKAQGLVNGASVINLEFNTNRPSASSEVGVFVVDDAEGRIDGLSPEDEGYLTAALSRASILFSPMPGNANFVSRVTNSATRSFIDGSYLSFFSVESGSVDSFLSESRAGRVTLSEIRQVNADSQSNFDLGVGETTVSAVSVDDSRIGTQLQGLAQAEVIDLTGMSGTENITFEVQREASLSSVIGFYVIDDVTGQVTNAEGDRINTDSQGDYIQAALQNRVADVLLRAGNNSLTTTVNTLEMGKVIAPFLIVEGTVDALLDSDSSNDPTIYFPFLGANSDGTDHIRLLGDNTFGFEDSRNGGDRDFDDMVLTVKFA